MKPVASHRALSHYWRNLWLYAIAGVLYWAVTYIPFYGFKPNAHAALAVFSVAAFLWISNALPLAITGIVVLLLLPLSGAISSQATYAYFGNDAIFFVLGAFILASPVMRSGLSTRIALLLITRCGQTPMGLLLSFFCLPAFLAFFISEHAVAAMMYPIVLEIITATKSKVGSRFAFAAFLAMGWGAIIGGTMTLLGGARAPLALGMLQSISHMNISFAGWTYYVYPMVLAMLAVAFLTVMLVAWGCKVNLNTAQEHLKRYQKELGGWSRRELLTLAVLGITVIMWLTIGGRIGLEAVAFIGVLLAFLTGITRWSEIEHDVQWGIFVMYGSAIALGAALRDTGAAHVIVERILSLGITSPITVFIILVGLSFILTEAMSNAAAVAVLMPIGLSLAPQFGIDPRAITLIIATAAGLTFLLPISTPAMAVITSVDYVSPARALRWGLVPKIIGAVLIILIAWWYWPWAGLTLF